LTGFAYRYSALEDELALQRAFLERLRERPHGAQNALANEQQFVNDLRHGEWPWADHGWESTKTSLDNAHHRFRALTNALRNHYFRQEDAELKRTLQTLVYECASRSESFADPPTSGAGEAVEPTKAAVRRQVDQEGEAIDEEAVLASRRRLTSPIPRRPLRMVALDEAWLITTGVAALVVAFIGYQTQFLDDASFDGGTGDYAALAAWALALQVAGTTVVQVVGRLATPAGASSA
jgi:hypothetical protein